MHWVQAAIDLIKAIVWPGVVLALGLTFKEDLRKLLPRVVKAGATGVEFEAQKQVVAHAQTGELREIPGIIRTDTIAAVEKKIYEELKVFNSDVHIDVLVRHLAQAQLQTAFERIYGIMFGSQVIALRALINNNGFAARANAIKFFEELAESRPELKSLGLTFDNWLQYLVRSELVTDDGNNIAITSFGRDFLMYIAETRGNEVKAG